MKTYREKMLKDVHNRNKFMNVCFEMAVIFKLCKGNSKLEHHVLSLLSLKEII